MSDPKAVNQWGALLLGKSRVIVLIDKTILGIKMGFTQKV